ncbi:hypothetical protein PGT21_030715 [Puccinia graminis f. sp. tritici]|uniref:Uncharacterized protein n=1 Tax=Puccinia graminis f. sp. tritici TaxID=56615 RepID=A0A5B0MP13_PUCGR|nr:hypothetical protein PGT21_030715 [Puccinia graminis f. sp. tritici]
MQDNLDADFCFQFRISNTCQAVLPSERFVHQLLKQRCADFEGHRSWFMCSSVQLIIRNPLDFEQLGISVRQPKPSLKELGLDWGKVHF